MRIMVVWTWTIFIFHFFSVELVMRFTSAPNILKNSLSCSVKARLHMICGRNTSIIRSNNQIISLFISLSVNF